MRKIYILLIAWVVLGLSFTSQTAFAERYAAIVVHDDTGEVLHSRGADSYRYPASITKVMTLYLLFEAIEQGKLSMDSRLKVSTKATKAPPSKVYLQRGDAIKVRDAIGLLITKSANDVALVVAEAIGKTEANFAKLMTKKARQLGMKRTTYRNASGLHHSKQRTTVRDIATLAQRMRRDFPQYYHLFKMTKYTYRGTTYRSHNRLLASYKGMEGMKTGYINASGFNLVAVAKRNNQRVITVVMGGRTSKSRNEQVSKLMDLGFSRLPNLTIVKAPLPQHLRTRKVASIATNTAVSIPNIPIKKPKILQAAINVPKVMPYQPRAATAPSSKTNRAQRDNIKKLRFTVVATSEEKAIPTPVTPVPTPFLANALKPLQFTIVE